MSRVDSKSLSRGGVGELGTGRTLKTGRTLEGTKRILSVLRCHRKPLGNKESSTNLAVFQDGRRLVETNGEEKGGREVRSLRRHDVGPTSEVLVLEAETGEVLPPGPVTREVADTLRPYAPTPPGTRPRHYHPPWSSTSRL